MTEQITLLDVCKLPDVQIHSKTALFKHIISKETPEMQELRQNIIKLSYTNKIIGVRGNDVGIVSKRLPLKIKPKHQTYNQINPETLEQVSEQTSFIPHRTFYVSPLPTVKKTQDNNNLKQIISNIPNQLQIKSGTMKIYNEYDNPPFKPNSSLKPRTQSMGKIRTYDKKQSSSKATKNPTKLNITRNRKSFSNLLRDMNSKKNNIVINPIRHQQNNLYKRFNQLQIKKAQTKDDSPVESFEGKYQEQQFYRK